MWEEYGESERALDLYQQALTANPRFERAAIASAILLARLGRRQEADSQLARAGAQALDPKLTNNLGIAFADGTVNESLYKEMLATLKMQEVNLLNNRHDIDPSRMDSLAALEVRIKAIKEFMAKGDLVLDEFGIYAMTDHHY